VLLLLVSLLSLLLLLLLLLLLRVMCGSWWVWQQLVEQGAALWKVAPVAQQQLQGCR
jgi:hypothetical protein